MVQFFPNIKTLITVIFLKLYWRYAMDTCWRVYRTKKQNIPLLCTYTRKIWRPVNYIFHSSHTPCEDMMRYMGLFTTRSKYNIIAAPKRTATLHCHSIFCIAICFPSKYILYIYLYMPYGFRIYVERFFRTKNKVKYVIWTFLISENLK